MLDLSQPEQPKKITSIKVDDIAADAEVNSVVVHNGIVAIAIQAAVKTDPGYVALYQAKDLSKLAHVHSMQKHALVIVLETDRFMT